MELNGQIIIERKMSGSKGKMVLVRENMEKKEICSGHIDTKVCGLLWEYVGMRTSVGLENCKW